MGTRPPIVLMYHQLVKQARPGHSLLGTATPVETFRADMKHVKERWSPVSLDQIARAVHEGEPLPRRAVAITFDDGYRNMLWAGEILRELGMTATFFVIADTMDGAFVPSILRFLHVLSQVKPTLCETPIGRADLGNAVERARWRSRIREHFFNLAEPEQDALIAELKRSFGASEPDASDGDLQFLRRDEVRRLAEMGMTIGSHTARHPKLGACDAATLEREVVGSAAMIAEVTGQPCDYFAYPYGRYTPAVRALAARTYRMAFAAGESVPPGDAHLYRRRNTATGFAGSQQPWAKLRWAMIRTVLWARGIKPAAYDE